MSIADEIKNMKFGQLEPPVSQVTKDLNELYQMRRMVEDEIKYKERLLNTINRAIEIIKGENKCHCKPDETTGYTQANFCNNCNKIIINNEKANRK